MKLNMDIKNPTDDQQYILDYLPVNNQWNYAIGTVYRHYRKNSYGTLASRNMLYNEAFKYENNLDTDPSKLNLRYTSGEIENKFRYEHIQTNGYKITWGGGGEYDRYTNNTFQRVFIPSASDTITSVKFDSALDFFNGPFWQQEARDLLMSC